MRKFAVTLLSFISIFALAISLPLLSVSALSSTPTNVKTTAFMPSSSLQLYDLKSPVSISYSNSGYMVIAEHIGGSDGSSLFDRISVYNPNTQKFGALNPHPTIYNVTHAEEYGGYVFYLSNSRLYCVPTSDLTKEPIETPITSSNFFSIKGGYLITNTNNSIIIYQVSVENGLNFTKKSTHNFTTKNAFISTENNVYYLFGGKLYCFDTQSSTSYEVATVEVDVNYMAEIGSFIYLSSGSGIFKVEKGAGKTLETVLETDDVLKLGHLSNPQGLTVMDGQLLIADPTIKCVQAINPATNEFTDFAITTESTADYRLTNNASDLMLSENYTFVLDDGETKPDGKTYKRIVKTAISQTAENRYKSYSLESLYQEDENLLIKYVACSDTHIAIYANKTLAVYDIQGDELNKIYSLESESVTSLFYLDGEFYYTDYALHNFEYNKVVAHKLTLPTLDNELTQIKNTKLNETSVIKGVATHSCVDVFGGVYLIVDEQNGSDKKLVKIKNGISTELNTIPYVAKTIRADFAGNVYVLSENNLIYKYAYDDYSNYQVMQIDSELPVKKIELNYKSNVCYMLSNACIIKTADDSMKIENLSAINSNTLNLSTVTQPKFITVDKSAKLFKINLSDVDSDGNFNSVTPISNPTADKVYLVIAEIENYYLVSHSNKLVALVRKTSTTYSPDAVFDSAIITSSHYQDFNIEIENLNGEEFYLTNQTTAFSKPIFDYNYKTVTTEKGEKVKAIEKITCNNLSMTLISDLSGNLKGYVISGYLTQTSATETVTTTNTIQVLTSNDSRHFNDTIMILVIALTVTLVALFIEKKLLFDKEDHNL